MTNEQFRKKLDRLTEKKQTLKSAHEFLEILTKGYAQKLNILIYGVGNRDDNDGVNQVCAMYDGKKAMLYLTDRKHEIKGSIASPAVSMYQPECWEVNVCDAINNAPEKDEVTALIFNPQTNNTYVIPKMMLALAIHRYGELPR